ncbi:MAG: TatD family deoxyribonuclease [Spirochaetes bacterium]|nr:MAG: TatD family deoxyribonuclease [Spirochaetota bacterium]
MRLVDVHCHLESDYFRDSLETILRDAARAGVVRLITSTTGPDEWERSASISARFPEVKFALGIHPWYCKPEDLPFIDELAYARDRGAIALGEIGLDSKIENSDFELQRLFFERQLAIARDLDLPVVLHCRGAFDAMHAAFRKIGAPARGGLLHSFSGSVEIAETFMKHGMMFSFGGALTFRNSKKKAAVLKRVYPDHMLLETDAPDIPPVESREMPNVPANIRYNLRAAAEILGKSEEEIAETTTMNASRLFGLGL